MPFPPVLVVDAANVVGARPDGWWRDRAGAAERLLARLAILAERGLVVPVPAGPDGDAPWRPEVVVVLEGAARAARDDGRPGLTLVRAPGEGDDAVVEQVRTRAGTDVVVATSDRELGRRVETEGARVRGAGWLLRQLDELDPRSPHAGA